MVTVATFNPAYFRLQCHPPSFSCVGKICTHSISDFVHKASTKARAFSDTSGLSHHARFSTRSDFFPCILLNNSVWRWQTFYRIQQVDIKRSCYRLFCNRTYVCASSQDICTVYLDVCLESRYERCWKMICKGSSWRNRRSLSGSACFLRQVEWGVLIKIFAGGHKRTAFSIFFFASLTWQSVFCLAIWILAFRIHKSCTVDSVIQVFKKFKTVYFFIHLHLFAFTFWFYCEKSAKLSPERSKFKEKMVSCSFASWAYGLV